MQGWLAVSEIVRNLGLVLAAAIGLVFAGMRVVAANRQSDAALKQAELERRNHVAELFNRAVAQLDEDKLYVRLGAIHTLIEIEGDFPDLTKAIYQVLAVYSRERDARATDMVASEDAALTLRWLSSRRRRRRP